MSRRPISEIRLANAKIAANLAKADTEVAKLMAEHRALTLRITRLEATAKPLVQARLGLERRP